FRLGARVMVPKPQISAQGKIFPDRAGVLFRMSIRACRTDRNQPADAGAMTGFEDVPRSVENVSLKSLPRPPIADLCSRVINDVNALHSSIKRSGIGQIA